MDLSSNLSGYYDRNYIAEDVQRVAEMNNHDAMLGLIGPNGLDASGMGGAQTLDEMISQNHKEYQRRRSYNQMQSYAPGRASQDPDPRRSSMLEFGSGSSNELDGFQFDPIPNQPAPSMHRAGHMAQRRIDGPSARRREPAETLALTTHFTHLNSNYSPIPTSSPFGQTLNPAEPMGLDMASNYMSNNMLMGLDYSAGGMDNEDNGDITSISMFPPGSYAANATSSPLDQNMSNSMRGPAQDPGGGNVNGHGGPDQRENLPTVQMSDQMQTLQVNLSQISMPMQPPTPVGPMQNMGDFHPPAKPPQSANLDTSAAINGTSFPNGDHPKSPTRQGVIPLYRNAYSASGFDMLGVLMRVATRPKPQINIGAVDMSCAFVVCDVTQHDLPIVYCSDIFERLTGYTKHEILGRNCRFLQAPDGKIQAGIKRKYVDDQSVLRIKNMITQRQEAQISLINYRKGGQPFMNLLTMIPITWDSDECKYYVGFQVDLVEQPTSITNKNPGEIWQK